jgi:hypothetical protein
MRVLVLVTDCFVQESTFTAVFFCCRRHLGAQRAFPLRFELPGLYLFFEYFRNSSLLVYIFTMAVINQPLITTPPEQRQPEPSTQDVMFFLPTTHTFVHSILISPTTVSSYGVKDRAPGGLSHR